MSAEDTRELEGRIVLVTGAAQGLGAQMARRFAGAGARVVIADVDEAGGRALAAELPGAAFRRLDVTREADWLAAWDSIERELGPLRILVNNAGIYKPNIPLEEMSLELWQRHFAINCDGPFLGCREALRRMKGRDGVVLNIASTAAVGGFVNGAAYSASKAAVAMLTRLAARGAVPVLGPRLVRQRRAARGRRRGRGLTRCASLPPRGPRPAASGTRRRAAALPASNALAPGALIAGKQQAVACVMHPGFMS